MSTINKITASEFLTFPSEVASWGGAKAFPVRYDRTGGPQAAPGVGPVAAIINGTNGVDTLTGTDDADEINGLGRGDLILGGGGNDIIRGGDETGDLAEWGDGVDGGAGDDTLYGGLGNDMLAGGLGADTIDGGDGDDYLYGRGGGITASLFWDATDDGVPFSAFSYTVGDPRVDDETADVLTGGAGNDLIIVGHGDTASGGDGVDRANAYLRGLTAGVTVDLRTDAGGVLSALLEGSVSGFENYFVEGTAFNDIMMAGAVDLLNGGAGDDVLTGGTGANNLAGGEGVDTVNGGAGSDTLSGFRTTVTSYLEVDGQWVSGGSQDDAAVDTVNGEDGNDAISVGYGDIADGGAGTDNINLTLIRRPTAVNLDLGGNELLVLSAVQGGAMVGFESVRAIGLTAFDDVLRLGVYGGGTFQFGYGGDDLIIGNVYTQYMSGNEGDDRLEGMGGMDSLAGGAGDDLLLGGDESDYLYGDADDNYELIPNAGQGADVLNGGAGDDSLYGGAGIDTAVFSSNRSAYGIVMQDNGVTRVSGPDGTDYLTDIERLQFADGLYGVDGNPLPNEVAGTPNADTLNGTAGRDAFTAGDGDDVITGAAGDDVVSGGAGMDTAVFSDGAYTVAVNAGVVTVTGPDGTDTLTNVERLRFGTADVMVAALQAANSLGTSAGETLTGGAAADGLFGLVGNDTLNGGDGDDLLAGGAGVDVLTGGAGVDTADYSAAAAGVAARLDSMRATNDGDGGTDTFTSVEAITGSAFNDLLVGGTLGDTLKGGLGADTLLGQGGNDVLWGGAGASNTLQGGVGDDRYVLEAADSVVEAAGAGTDTVEARINAYNLAANVENLVFGGAGNFSGTGNVLNNVMTGGAGDDLLRGRGGVDSLIGASGIDTADYSQAAAGIHARLDNMRAVNDGDGATDTFTSIEAILGSAFNDTLVGGTLGDRLSGGLGADTLLGFAGNDILAGGQGLANQLQGGLGDDLYVLDAYDSIVEMAGQGHDTIEAHVGAHNMASNVEDMFYVGFNKFYGTGNASNNTITGGIGDDILKGMGGSDRLFGGAGLDEVQVRGTKAQYTVTAEGSGWRIVDSVAGRDGSTYVESIETLRFMTGNTKTVLTYPHAGSPTEDAKSVIGDAFVMPALAEDQGPQVVPELPGDLLAAPQAAGYGGLAAMLDANPLVVEGPHGLHLLMDEGQGPGHDGWLF